MERVCKQGHTAEVGKKCPTCHAASSAAWRARNIERVRENTRKYAAKWRANNLEHIRGYDAERRAKWRAKWRANNLEHVRGYAAKWRADNLERARGYAAKWRADSPDAVRESTRRSSAKKVEGITPSYIAGIVKLPVAALTPGMVEAKRAHLKIKRLIKEAKNEVTT